MTRFYIQGDEGMELLPECFEPDPERCVEVSGMDWFRVFSACQALMLPSGFYGVTHKRCREVIREHLGSCPKGKPGHAHGDNSKFRKGGAAAISEWLGIEAVVHRRGGEGAITSQDATFLYLNKA